MALVTTSVVDTGVSRRWDLPLGPRSAPRVQILYSGTTTIPAKIINDESLYTLSCRLPTNFAYRLNEIQMTARVPANVDMNDWSQGMSVQWAVGGVTIRQFILVNAMLAYQGGGTQEQFAWSATATNDLLTVFLPPHNQVLNHVIVADAPASTAQILVNWVDVTTSTDTAEIDLDHWVSVYQYDIDEQLRDYPMNAPIPTITL